MAKQFLSTIWILGALTSLSGCLPAHEPVPAVPPTASGAPPRLDPNSHPHAVLMDAFIASGYQSEEAAARATQCLVGFTGKNMRVSSHASILRRADAIYSRDGTLYRHATYISALADEWECGDRSKGSCPYPECAPSQLPAFQLTISERSEVQLPVKEVWLVVYPDRFGVRSDEIDGKTFTCNSFEEIVPLQCDAIERTCCQPPAEGWSEPAVKDQAPR